MGDDGIMMMIALALYHTYTCRLPAVAAVSRRRRWLRRRAALRRVRMTVLDVAISNDYEASWIQLGCLLQLLKRGKM